MLSNNIDENIKKIEELHIKYSHGKYKDKFKEIVWTHSLIISEIAIQICNSLETKYGIRSNLELAQIGSLVHDIGVYQCYDDEMYPDKNAPMYISHGLLGEKILRGEGYSIEIARFASCHTGTGLTIEDIEKDNLPYPKKDFIAITLEEEIVMYADKFHSKYPCFSTFEKQRELLSKFNPIKGIKMDLFKQKFGIPNLDNLEHKYSKWNLEIDKFLDQISRNK